MGLKELTTIMLPAIEAEIKKQTARVDEPHTYTFHEMITYHMGWTGDGAGPDAAGKRIRPLLVLLVTAANTPDWPRANPAAAAVELIHNFSLVHDDIQDNSELRRGRETVWKKWGVAQAINAGDGLFVLANLAIIDLTESYPTETVLQVANILYTTCLNLTRGQFLDIAYASFTDLDIKDYWDMVSGKTAALLSACTQIGAILGGAEESVIDAYQEFGHYLGLAFQIQDDYLGIWGDSALTGKSNLSDLVTGKKSMPVLYGLQKAGAFAQRWHAGPIRADEVTYLSQKLSEEGAQLFTQQTADQMTTLALNALRIANPQGEAGEALHEFVQRLLQRES